MLQIHDEPRLSGKTYEIIQRLRKDFSAMCFVPNKYMKENLYPKDVQDRVFVYTMQKFNRFEQHRIYSTFIFDEVFTKTEQSYAFMLRFCISDANIEIYSTFE